VLVNNAGVTRDGLLMRMKSDDWDAVLNTNLKGAFHLTKPVGVSWSSSAPGDRQHLVGHRPHGQRGQANYAASKAGLIGFTKSIAREFASRNITCNVVCPGFIETDMTKGLGDDCAKNCWRKSRSQRLGQPEDVAGVVAFLLARGQLRDRSNLDG
jgi:3-oxoacyl-[acyl-carrier protein] reductase